MEVLPEGVSAPIKKGPGLHEFLMEAELAHYFNSFKNSLKVTHPSQLKFATDEDLIDLGMSKPELRRMRKYYDKHFASNYLSKFKKLLTNRKQQQLLNEFGGGAGGFPGSGGGEYVGGGRAMGDEGGISKQPRVPNKHIISPANITVNKELGMGEFGVVQQGVWCNEGERIQVAIKCLVRERMQTNTIEFLKEAVIMHSIDHPHIVRLFGVVLDMGSLMLVTELAPLRSLLECLKEPSVRSSFPVMTLADFAVQICDGMQYLEAKRFIHRDLAARNILVFSKNKVKISDFGLSRALGQGKDYYQTNFNVNLKLPIAWCAPECISYLRFTTASDVWAYGVTLWEMFSYGFQPWAALTGQQILEAIDDPHFQRLEQPDCCPHEYYALMLDCWRHEPTQRPRFSEVAAQRLPDCRPEQVQAKVTLVAGACADQPAQMIGYRVGDVVTVLDKLSHRPLWKGISPTGKSGLFDPTNFISYLGPDLPSLQSSSSSALQSNSTLHASTSHANNSGGGVVGGLLSGSGSLLRSSVRRSKLRSEMISGPQGEVKHTGHVGLDGAYFGDISFLSGGGKSTEYNSNIPTQIVPPYRPTADTHPHHHHHHHHLPPDSTPLIDHTPPTNDHHLLQNSTTTIHHHHHHGGFHAQASTVPAAHGGRMDVGPTGGGDGFDHEYHEISDEEELDGLDVGGGGGGGSPDLDLGPSLMAEMEMMFSSLGGGPPPPSPADHDGSNKTNELREKLNTGGGTLTKANIKANKLAATVKPISAQDSKTLDTAIAIANELSTTRPKSSSHHHHHHHHHHGMSTGGGAPPPLTPTSPGGANGAAGSGGKRKFSFRFPSASNGTNSSGSGAGGSVAGGGMGDGSGEFRNRNFAEEAQSTPDLQRRLRASLSSLDKIPPVHNPSQHIRLPLWDKASAEFCFAKSRELLTKPFPPPSQPNASIPPSPLIKKQQQQQTLPPATFYTSCRDVHVQHANSIDDPYVREVQNRRRVLLFERPGAREYYNPPKGELICEDDHDLYPSQLYRNRMCTQSENMTRKIYYSPHVAGNDNNRFVYDRNQQIMLLHDARPPPPSPFNSRTEDYRTIIKTEQDFIYQRTNDSSSYTPIETYDNVFLYDDPPTDIPPPPKPSSTSRTRATSFSRAESCDSSAAATVRRSVGRSVRDRNRRRQSYNPRAYMASSSSSDEDSVSADCASLGSVDFDWRRRRRLSRLSASNSSIRSEMVVRSYRLVDAASPALCRAEVAICEDKVDGDRGDGGENCADFKLLQEPDLIGMLGKGFGRSPPPSSNVLSGLSPTSASRLQAGSVGIGQQGDSGGSNSSDSSL